jgi:fructoselysine-6-P-deglycase FrlB-like protein
VRWSPRMADLPPSLGLPSSLVLGSSNILAGPRMYLLDSRSVLRDDDNVSYLEEELGRQPEFWLRAAELAVSPGTPLPKAGDRVALIGCGTSLFMAQTAASFRESQGLGWTDAFPASEVPWARKYDMVMAISRSGTTTEVLEAVRRLSGSQVVAITAAQQSPLVDLATHHILLSFADEQSVVQTCFATTALAVLLAAWGWDVKASASRAAAVLGSAVPEEVDAARQFVFLGSGPTTGIASEAALKLREVLGAWSEAYPTMEFRHGPIASIGEHSLVWALDRAEPSIDNEIAKTGARLLRSEGDPLSELVRVHMAAAYLAARRHIDADHPRFLARSIILSGR